MNNLIQLKGQLKQRKHPQAQSHPSLPSGKEVSSSHLRSLIQDLQRTADFWQHNTLIGNALISVHYTMVIAKSNRLQHLLAEREGKIDEQIRGARFETVFSKDRESIRHVFTYLVSEKTLRRTISELQAAASILDHDYGSVITAEQIRAIDSDRKSWKNSSLSALRFLRILVDAFHVAAFDVSFGSAGEETDALVTIYKTGVDARELLRKIGIDIRADRIIDGNTLRLTPEQQRILTQRAPYLIAMSVTNFEDLTPDSFDEMGSMDQEEAFPEPNGEPVIGVIDTQFDTTVYFHKWVEYHNMLDDPNIPLTAADCIHGTRVDSILVDGPRLNPWLDDGCGRFRVCHFGVATHDRTDVFYLYLSIDRIVRSRPDIKVWNLSLGSEREVDPNCISPIAALLDHLQNAYDIIFVIAGTNLNSSHRTDGRTACRIGSPADSLNAVVVNALNASGEPASYTRVGPVLSFFNKPDVSCFGGDGNEISGLMALADANASLGASYGKGTSFAAPWIARKLAFLIYIMGLSREASKALLIDSARGWSCSSSFRSGYGSVPISIEDVISAGDDEIRFLLTGTATEYETYAFNIPVPIVKNGQPFLARAVLCYFPDCDRNQGVDYTDTEMDLHLGRVITKKNEKKDGSVNSSVQIHSINNNVQAEEGLHILYEGNAREEFRKWDNVKCISEKTAKNRRAKKFYDSGNWGISLKIKDRSPIHPHGAIPFAIVVTLKEINGVNRCQDFIRLCEAKGWLVSEISIENRLQVYQETQQEVRWE